VLAGTAPTPGGAAPIIDAFVRQAEALLCDVHAQHGFQADRRATASITLRVVRQERRNQRRPWRHSLDLPYYPDRKIQSNSTCFIAARKYIDD
jgi:hypothetical protein